MTDSRPASSCLPGSTPAPAPPAEGAGQERIAHTKLPDDRTRVLEQHLRECQEAEREVRETLSLVLAVLDHLPTGVAVNSVDPAVEFSYMNDTFPTIYRTTRELLADPDSFWEAVYQDPVQRKALQKRVLEDCATGDASRMHWEDVPITRDGEPTRYISARDVPIPGKRLVISLVWDVTERLVAEAKIAEQLAELRRWYDATLGREARVLELKHEVNELLTSRGLEPRYPSALDEGSSPEDGA